MTDERLRRVGENEALYRQVNEQARRITQGMATVLGAFNVLCECGTVGCMEQISVTPDVYESARSRSHRFIVLPGHEIDETEAVVEDHETFHVVEKVPPKARGLAEETDPRRD
jgi:hypothetical protein